MALPNRIDNTLSAGYLWGDVSYHHYRIICICDLCNSMLDITKGHHTRGNMLQATKSLHVYWMLPVACNSATCCQ